jgi:hypothetical protein
MLHESHISNGLAQLFLALTDVVKDLCSVALVCLFSMLSTLCHALQLSTFSFSQLMELFTLEHHVRMMISFHRHAFDR